MPGNQVLVSERNAVMETYYLLYGGRRKKVMGSRSPVAIKIYSLGLSNSLKEPVRVVRHGVLLLVLSRRPGPPPPTFCLLRSLALIYIS